MLAACLNVVSQGMDFVSNLSILGLPSLLL